MRTRKRQVPSPAKENVKRAKVKRSRRAARFLVGKTIEKIPQNQLPLRKEVIQYFLFLRDKYPKKALTALVSCTLEEQNFR